MIETVELTQRFGGLVALDSVTISVRPGEIRALIGPNGSGKTTMLNVLTGFYKPTSGRVSFNGDEITGSSPFEVARRGVVRTFQNINLFSGMTVLQNVMTGFFCRTRVGFWPVLFGAPSYRNEARETRERAMDLLTFVGLADQADLLASNLPYGKQRLLEIARALAVDPKVLLLDEPVAGMNERESADTADLVRKIQERDITILLIEHHMRFVMALAERVTVLNSGRVIAEGTPAEIQNNPQVIAVYLGKGRNRARH